MTGPEPEDAADAFAADIVDLFSRFANMDPDERATTTISLFASERVDNGTPHVAVSGVSSIPTEEHERLERVVLDRVDLRKAPRAETARRGRGKSVRIGSITFLGSGEILEIDIDTAFVKPSAREGGPD